jgi:hypothetical protein
LSVVSNALATRSQLAKLIGDIATWDLHGERIADETINTKNLAIVLAEKNNGYRLVSIVLASRFRSAKRSTSVRSSGSPGVDRMRSPGISRIPSSVEAGAQSSVLSVDGVPEMEPSIRSAYAP